MMNRLFAAALLLLSGWASAAFLYYEQPNPAPYLADIGTLPACDFVISDAAGWAQINNAAYRIFCVAPGDYRSVGQITISADGTSTAKKWLRYHNAAIADSVHPYQMTAGQRALVSQISLTGANYWVFDRLSLQPNTSAWGTTYHTFMTHDSNYNVFSRLYLYGNYGEGIRLEGGSYNTVQHCVINGQAHGWDSAGILFQGRKFSANEPQPKYNIAVSNEIIDYNDPIHLGGNPEDSVAWADWGDEDYEGTVVYNNDLYYTTATAMNCTTGAYETSGLCDCKEDHIDIKSGSSNAAAPVIIAHNRLWGSRPAPLTLACGGQTAGKGVSGMTAHNYIENFRFEGNVLDKAETQFANGYDNLTISGNLWSESPSERPHSTYVQRFLSALGPLTSAAITGNVFTGIDDNIAWYTVSLEDGWTTSTAVSFTDNVIINSNAFYTEGNTFAGTVSGNKYYNSTNPTWDATPAADEASVTGSGWDNQFCTTRKRLTAPETWCLDNAFYSTGSPVPITPPSQFQIVD